jgi:hypothetical protein
MENFSQAVTEIRTRLQQAVDLQRLPPKELDHALEVFHDLGLHQSVVPALTAHYKVPYKTLTEMLISRQLILVHQLTDYSKPATEVDLQQLLVSQHTRVAEMLDRMGTLISQVEAGVAQAKFLNDEAARVIAHYKEQFLKEPAV